MGKKMLKISNYFRVWRLPSINGTSGIVSNNLRLNKVGSINLNLKLIANY